MLTQYANRVCRRRTYVSGNDKRQLLVRPSSITLPLDRRINSRRVTVRKKTLEVRITDVVRYGVQGGLDNAGIERPAYRVRSHIRQVVDASGERSVGFESVVVVVAAVHGEDRGGDEGGNGGLHVGIGPHPVVTV